MKRTGFTLAEVLITLAIIGVVATMTLPALMNNTQEQQAITGLKKGINTLTEAAQTNQAVAGFDYAGLIEDSKGVNTAGVDEDQSLTGLLVNRTQVDYKASNNGGSGDANAIDSASGNYVVFLRDGSALSYPTAKQTGSDVAEIEADGLPHGFGVIYDINGIKKPNLLSNCDSKANLTADSTSRKDVSTDCTKANRVIKDQFGIRLRGAFAYPNGAAARWAFGQ
ncbi:MAG: type II secretion system GspH family protein [bacterium]|nr:type II secretion system GspH family protein [bacterium]